MNINSKIKKLLTTQRRTMSELAVFCGVTPQAVKQWVDEHGTSPRGNRLKKIAEFFELSEAELQFGDIDSIINSHQYSRGVAEEKRTYNAEPALFDRTTAPYYEEIEKLIKLMESSDDRGRMKMYLAALDAHDLHESHLSRTNTKAFSQDEIEAIEVLRNSSEFGKSLIKTAIETAKNGEIAQQTKKAS